MQECNLYWLPSPLFYKIHDRRRCKYYEFLTSPVLNSNDLVARLEALLRRATGGVRRRTLSYAGVALDGVKWTASRDNAPLTLTTVEFKLLEALMLKPERVLTRDELLQAVWGDSVGYDSNVVDVHITNLRRKLEATGRPRIIQAVRRVGYKLEA